MEGLIGLSSTVGVGYCASYLKECLDKIPLHEVEPRIKCTQLMITAMGTMIWPVVLVWVLNKEWRSGVLSGEKLLWLSSLWVAILFIIDAYIMSSTPSSQLDSAQHQQREVKSNFLSIVSTVFAFGVLLSNIAKNSKYRSSRSAQTCICGLLLGLAFTIPSFETEGDSYKTHVMLAVTKTASIIAVGTFMSGVVLELSHVNRFAQDV
jgi:hypothetical protein